MTLFHRTIIVALALFAVCSVFLTIPPETKFRTGADEGAYFRYASAVNEQGIRALRDLAGKYTADTDTQTAPSPIRAGHILATSAWLRIASPSYVALARFSFLCFCLFLAVSFYFCRKHFGGDTAFLFLLLLSSSPLMMAMGRRALSDMHGNLWCGLVVWLFLDFLRDRKRSTFILLIAAYSAAILVREASLLLWPFLIAAFLLSWRAYRNELKAIHLAGLIVGPAVLVGIAYLLIFGWGGALNLLATAFSVHGNASAQTSPYAIRYCTGPWFTYLVDFIVLSPVVGLLFLGYTGHKLIQRDYEWHAMYFLLYFGLTYALFSSLRYSIVLRFVINLDMVMALFAALCIQELVRSRNPRLQAHVALILAAAIFFLNYATFTQVFCIGDIYDPTSVNILSARNLIPR